MKPLRSAVLSCSGAALAVLATSAIAEESPDPGHSAHGQAFSEGPRTAARLIEGCGEVHFPVTTDQAEAQQFFDQAIGQLHGFWFLEAERSFRQVLEIDPDCLMAYWGIAMANVGNVKRGHKVFEALDDEDLKPAWNRLPEREKRLITSLRDTYAKLDKAGNYRQPGPWRQLVADWEQWLVDHPGELEMKAFLVGLIWRNHYRHNVKISSHLSVAALANEVLEVQPSHPIHHYLIHLWDRVAAERALDSAAMCGPAAPAIAHMWHMPGHIYAKLDRHADAAWYQEASSRVDHAHMIRDAVMPELIHNYVHNQGWLVDSLSHIGRVDDALALARNLVELPRIPTSSALDEEESQTWTEKRSGFSAGRTRLLRVLWTWEAWDQAIAWSETPWLDATGDERWQDQRHWLLATAALRSDRPRRAAKELLALQERRNQLTRSIDAAEDRVREKQPDIEEKELAKAVENERKPLARRLAELDRLLGELRAFQLWSKGAEEEALAAFDEIKNVPKLRHIRWLIETGQPDQALPMARELVQKEEGRLPPVIAWARAAHQAEDNSELEQAFAQLRTLASQADLHAAPLARLLPAAQELGLADDWRQPAKPPKGQRPPHDTLGPLKWHPPTAPEWQLTGADLKSRSSDDLRGQPYLLIFYLGRECVHCMEQLNAFAPAANRFTEAGLPIVAVSTDSVEGLRQTFRATDDGGSATPFPFPLVSDESGDTFRRFRAWDDFEDMPLHGTYLIDADGRIRWQHISFEPFMEVDFLLEEATRLLRIPIDSPDPRWTGKLPAKPNRDS